MAHPGTIADILQRAARDPDHPLSPSSETPLSPYHQCLLASQIALGYGFRASRDVGHGTTEDYNIDFSAPAEAESYALTDFTHLHSENRDCRCRRCTEVLSFEDMLREQRPAVFENDPSPNANDEAGNHGSPNPINHRLPHLPRLSALESGFSGPIDNRTTSGPQTESKRTGHHRRTNARLLDRRDLDLAADGSPPSSRPQVRAGHVHSKSDVAFPEHDDGESISLHDLAADDSMSLSAGGPPIKIDKHGSKELGQMIEAPKTPDCFSKNRASDTFKTPASNNSSARTVSRFTEHIEKDPEEDQMADEGAPKSVEFSEMEKKRASIFSLTALPRPLSTRKSMVTARGAFGPSTQISLSNPHTPNTKHVAASEKECHQSPGVKGSIGKAKERLRNLTMDSITLLGIKKEPATPSLKISSPVLMNSTVNFSAFQQPQTPAPVSNSTATSNNIPHVHEHRVFRSALYGGSTTERNRLKKKQSSAWKHKPLPLLRMDDTQGTPSGTVVLDPSSPTTISSTAASFFPVSSFTGPFSRPVVSPTHPAPMIDRGPISPTSIHVPTQLADVIGPPAGSYNLNCLASSSRVFGRSAAAGSSVSGPIHPQPSLLARVSTLEHENASLKREKGEILTKLEQTTKDWHETYEKLLLARFQAFEAEGEVERLGSGDFGGRGGEVGDQEVEEREEVADEAVEEEEKRESWVTVE